MQKTYPKKLRFVPEKGKPFFVPEELIPEDCRDDYGIDAEKLVRHLVRLVETEKESVLISKPPACGKSETVMSLSVDRSRLSSLVEIVRNTQSEADAAMLKASIGFLCLQLDSKEERAEDLLRIADIRRRALLKIAGWWAGYFECSARCPRYRECPRVFGKDCMSTLMEDAEAQAGMDYRKAQMEVYHVQS